MICNHPLLLKHRQTEHSFVRPAQACLNSADQPQALGFPWFETLSIEYLFWNLIVDKYLIIWKKGHATDYLASMMASRGWSLTVCKWFSVICKTTDHPRKLIISDMWMINSGETILHNFISGIWRSVEMICDCG